MPKLTLEAVQKAAKDAFLVWASEQEPEGTWQYMCRVDPAQGFPQQSVVHTAYSTALFAEIALIVREADDSVVRVTYRGVPDAEQDQLLTLVTSKLADVTVERREHGTLDFSLLAHRATDDVPHSIRLAFESEMKPISGKGRDPDQLVHDLVKLALIDARFKFFIGRINGGRETVSGGEKRPKWDRLKPVIESAMTFSGNRAEETVALILETGQVTPWQCHLVRRDAGAAPSSRSFEVAD